MTLTAVIAHLAPTTVIAHLAPCAGIMHVTPTAVIVHVVTVALSSTLALAPVTSFAVYYLT